MEHRLREHPRADRGTDGAEPCPACGGARLRAGEPRGHRGGAQHHEYTTHSARAALAVDRSARSLTETERAIARLVVREIAERLRFLDSVGTRLPDRWSGPRPRSPAARRSGSGSRPRSARRWSGVLYILDEPTIGLHQRDNERLIDTLQRLRDLGNTVIVVEHDEATIRAADHLIDLGPGRRRAGG